MVSNLSDILFHYFIYKFIEIIRKNWYKEQKKEALSCIKVKCFEKFPMIIKLFYQTNFYGKCIKLCFHQKFPMIIKLFYQTNFYGKCIKLCFHVQIFSVNCFCVSFNPLSGNG